MSSVTHRATALKRTHSSVTISLSVVHPDETGFCFEKNCALQILWARANPTVYEPSPLGGAVTLQNILDAQWLVTNADRFIESVELLDSENYPLPDGLSAGDVPEQSRPKATIRITATNPEWIAHLADGMSWNTAPFDATMYL